MDEDKQDERDERRRRRQAIYNKARRQKFQEDKGKGFSPTERLARASLAGREAVQAELGHLKGGRKPREDETESEKRSRERSTVYNRARLKQFKADVWLPKEERLERSREAGRQAVRELLPRVKTGWKGKGGFPDTVNVRISEETAAKLELIRKEEEERTQSSVSLGDLLRPLINRFLRERESRHEQPG